MFWTAIIFGLVSSLHCIGMCGPIAMALSSTHSGNPAVNALAYNIGRISTYGILGMLIGWLGSGLNMIGFQQYVSIIAGGLILLFVLLPYKWKSRLGLNYSLTQHAGFRKVFQKLLKSERAASRWVVGLINGLLPCGMVYIAMAAALTQPSVIASAAYMVIFGLGTAPVMVGIYLSGHLLKPKFRSFILSKTPFILSFMACLFIFRGLALGIPYLSPKIEKDKNEVKVECCEVKN